MYSIVTTTTANAEDATKLVKLVLENQLAACVQILDIQSHYQWEGKLQNEAEKFLQMKTRSALVPELTNLIKNHHPYTTPQILEIPITSGHPAYLAWVTDSTKASPQQ